MYCLIVKHGDIGRYELLYKVFGERMPVVWDCRHRERRRTSAPPEIEERRRKERRGPPPASWSALGFVVVDRDSRW